MSSLILSTNKLDNLWNNTLSMLNQYTFRQDLSELNKCEVLKISDKCATTLPIRIFELEKISYNPKEGIVDKLVNIYSSLNSLNTTVFIIIRGCKDGSCHFYIGCRNRTNRDLSERMMKSSFEGNFPGVVLKGLSSIEKDELLDEAIPLEYDRKSVVSLSVSPDFRKERTESTDTYIQGIEKFIDAMKGQEYSAVFVAEPISHEDTVAKRAAYESILTELSKYNKISLGYSEGSSVAINESLAEGISTSISNSISNSTSTNTSYSVGKSKTGNHGAGFGFFGFSTNNGTSRGKSTTNTSGSSDSHSDSRSDTSSNFNSSTKGTTDTTTTGTNFSINVENRTITRMVEKIEYELKKLDRSGSYGLWDAAVYVISPQKETSMIAASNIRSLVLGDNSSNADAFINTWGNDAESFSNGTVQNIMEFLHYGMHPVFRKSLDSVNKEFYFTPAIAIGGDVVPSLMGIPTKSVSGVTVIETPEFGRNVSTSDIVEDDGDKLHLGEIIYMGKPDKTPVEISVNSLSAHTFICGAPGSGKSNTVYGILQGLSRISVGCATSGTSYGKIKFLIVEPAKGEYKFEFAKFPGINIYGTQPNMSDMLRINPFEFPHEYVNITEHIERIKNIITACWALTAAMPAILEESIEMAYRKCGWDLDNSIFVNPGDVVYPSFGDVLDVLPRIINRSEYSSDTKGDYIGALVTRVASLTRGISGKVLCKTGTIPDRKLFDENTIIDLSNIGSNEARSLIMGIIVMKLESYRKANAEQANYPLRHVTVLEEAHNLLPRVSRQQSDDSSNMQGKSVELICNAISEMRTYGEGFIIVDQTPSNVDSIAITNTSTKIIMRLPGEEDIKAAGASIGLSDDQLLQVPMLSRGMAIIKQGDWIDPVVTMIEPAKHSFFSRKLPEYSYEDLKAFRGELVEKLIHVEQRNRERNRISSADIDLLIKFIDSKKGIALHEKSIISEELREFAKLGADKRRTEFSRLIVDIIRFKEALKICTPELKQKPVKLENPTGEYLKELNAWYERLKDMMDNYVVGNEKLTGKILEMVMHYCRDFNVSKLHEMCAISLISVKKYE